jgi:serine/threonine protein kinase
MALSSGGKLGPYEIESPLGASGMGEVYRAFDTRLYRNVAIKILPASFSGDPDRLQHFIQESRATAVLKHPNILAILGGDRGARHISSANYSKAEEFLQRVALAAHGLPRFSPRHEALRILVNGCVQHESPIGMASFGAKTGLGFSAGVTTSPF